MDLTNGLITVSPRKYTVSQYLKDNVASEMIDGVDIGIHYMVIPPQLAEIDYTSPTCLYPMTVDGHIKTLLNVGYLSPDEEKIEQPSHQHIHKVAQKIEKPIIDNKKAENYNVSAATLPEFLNYENEEISYSFSNKPISGYRIFKYKNDTKDIVLRIPEKHYQSLNQAYNDDDTINIQEPHYNLRMLNKQDVSLTRKMNNCKITVRIAKKIDYPYRVNLTSLQGKKIVTIFDNHTNLRLEIPIEEFNKLYEAYNESDNYTYKNETYTFSVRANKEASIIFNSSSNRKKKSRGELFYNAKILDKVFE